MSNDGLFTAKESAIKPLPMKAAMEREQAVDNNEFYLIDSAIIDNMPIGDLRSLCKRMACQCGLIARMTREETAQAMLDTLAETALKPIVMGLNVKADIQSRMTAIDKWLDRTEGKATQRIEQKIEYSDKTDSIELTNSQLVEALRQANIAGLLPANVKLQENGDVILNAEYEDVTVDQ